MPEPTRSRYHYSTQDLTRYFTFRQPQTLTSLLDRLAACSLSAVLVHQVIHWVLPFPGSKFKNVLTATRRPTEHTLIILNLKVLIEFWNYDRVNQWGAYKIGAVTGLLGYILSRPLDQLDLARA